MKHYEVLIHRETYTKAQSYLDNLRSGHHPGAYLQARLKDTDIAHISVEAFIEALMNTKLPQIFAESAVCGDGSDWTHNELSILGDISIAVPVTVYDDGRHRNPNVHNRPFPATLLFTAGALLRNGMSQIPADWEEVTKNGELHSKSYERLYERRLFPAFAYADALAKREGRTAFITIPGIGCGQFAGKFIGRLGDALKNALIALLENHGSDLPNIQAVYYDPYRECDNERFQIHGITFMVRPLTKGNMGKPQLCHPKDYEEPGDHFADCAFFSFVAWDHVSWPGNDFYIGSRATDDGVKAAATNAMAVMTGIEGQYDPQRHQYSPPAGYRNWSEVVTRNKIHLKVKDNLNICP